ncbi:jg22538, partial [Pararge aegeria aegeria]
EAKNDMHLLKKVNEDLRTDVRNLHSRLYLFERESRACNLEIHCVPEHRNENLVNMVEQIGKITGNPIKEGQISKCTRIAKLNKDSPRPRTVLVKFFSPITRDQFYASIIKFNKNKSKEDKLNTSHLGLAGEKYGVFIMEHLSPEAKALHAQARKFKKENQWQFVWSRNGNIFMRKNISSDVVYIKNADIFHTLV